MYAVVAAIEEKDRKRAFLRVGVASPVAKLASQASSASIIPPAGSDVDVDADVEDEVEDGVEDDVGFGVEVEEESLADLRLYSVNKKNERKLSYQYACPN